MKQIIEVFMSKRFKSFYWRTAMMVIAGFLTLVVEQIGDFGLSPQVAVVLGLILGEISKALNSKSA